MSELTLITRNGKAYVDSRNVAEKVGKRHDHLLRDIDKYLSVIYQNPSLGADDFFIKSTYQSGTGKEYPCYLITKKGCDMVANKLTGTKGINFTAEYVSKFEEMNAQLANPFFEKIPKDLPSALIAYAEALKEKEALAAQLEDAEKTIEKNKPHVHLARSITASQGSILIGDLAKILKQNGVNIGQNRLFQWMRDNDYLISRKGVSFNRPTQKAMESGLFEVKETGIPEPESDDRSVVKITPMVTGKGQLYFTNLFKESMDITRRILSLEQ